MIVVAALAAVTTARVSILPTTRQEAVWESKGCEKHITDLWKSYQRRFVNYLQFEEATSSLPVYCGTYLYFTQKTYHFCWSFVWSEPVLDRAGSSHPGRDLAV